eukprot:4851548-Alexandrium_andersonii.AAC.1
MPFTHEAYSCSEKVMFRERAPATSSLDALRGSQSGHGHAVLHTLVTSTLGKTIGRTLGLNTCGSEQRMGSSQGCVEIPMEQAAAP